MATRKVKTFTVQKAQSFVHYSHVDIQAKNKAEALRLAKEDLYNDNNLDWEVVKEGDIDNPNFMAWLKK